MTRNPQECTWLEDGNGTCSDLLHDPCTSQGQSNGPTCLLHFGLENSSNVLSHRKSLENDGRMFYLRKLCVSTSYALLAIFVMFIKVIRIITLLPLLPLAKWYAGYKFHVVEEKVNTLLSTGLPGEACRE
ncbi:hypothetical protein V1477_005284 [Vespula maculifrons]|uniref:Uncharacterized protein n=1 Tax=Vespula maculifrons TaxID=7453 RepID=A0ABD2CQ48_VESMC